MSRCTGHCCRTFTLPFGPEQLQDAYERWQHQSEPIHKAGLTSADTKIWQDIWLIAPMVTYLGFSKKAPVKQVNPSDNELLGKPPEGYHYYSCKHFDSKKRSAPSTKYARPCVDDTHTAMDVTMPIARGRATRRRRKRRLRERSV